jgi:hypothetical protein
MSCLLRFDRKKGFFEWNTRWFIRHDRLSEPTAVGFLGDESPACHFVVGPQFNYLRKVLLSDWDRRPSLNATRTAPDPEDRGLVFISYLLF